jgi:hypothetical protein
MNNDIRMKYKVFGECDFCGLKTEVLQSDIFDNGNASNTQITICRSCARNLDNLFELLDIKTYGD